MAKKNLNAAAEHVAGKLFSAAAADEATEVAAKRSAKVNLQKSHSQASEDNPTSDKPKKKVFSFRADPDDIKVWRTYANVLKVKGQPADQIWSAAISEYIKKHPLSGSEKDLYESTFT